MNVIIDSTQLIAEIDQLGQSGGLKQARGQLGPRYNASLKYPGHIEQCWPDGTVLIGHWVDNRFVPGTPP